MLSFLTSVRRVRVGADHHPSRERVVLQHDLVDDAGPGPPEADPVLGPRRREEVVDLAVGLDGQLEVGDAAEAPAAVVLRGGGALDQVVTVDRRGDRRAREAGGDELQDCHLRRRVLHRDTVGAQAQVGLAAADVLALGVVEVAVDNLIRNFGDFGARERERERGR